MRKCRCGKEAKNLFCSQKCYQKARTEYWKKKRERVKK